jgi:sec-independent protein translocase protein TatC
MAPRLLVRLRRSGRPTPDAMTLGEHIAELRNRVLVAAVAVVVAGVAAFVVYDPILRFLQHPYCQVAGPRHCTFYITAPLQGLSIRMEVATYGGLFLASPVIFWELWRFITPGLERNERRVVVPFAAASAALFLFGVVLAYVIFPHALQFLDTIGGPTLRQIYSPTSYLGLLLALMALFGVAFEFPLALVALELVGLVQPSTLAHGRRWAFVLIVAGAAIFTPSGDPFSMLALAIPLYVFYELAIVVGRLVTR